MCRAVRCEYCGKATWAGCGRHLDAAMAGVKPEDRCSDYLNKSGKCKFALREDGQQQEVPKQQAKPADTRIEESS